MIFLQFLPTFRHQPKNVKPKGIKAEPQEIIVATLFDVMPNVTENSVT